MVSETKRDLWSALTKRRRETGQKRNPWVSACRCGYCLVERDGPPCGYCGRKWRDQGDREEVRD